METNKIAVQDAHCTPDDFHKVADVGTIKIVLDFGTAVWMHDGTIGASYSFTGQNEVSEKALTGSAKSVQTT